MATPLNFPHTQKSRHRSSCSDRGLTPDDHPDTIPPIYPGLGQELRGKHWGKLHCAYYKKTNTDTKPRLTLRSRWLDRSRGTLVLFLWAPGEQTGICKKQHKRFRVTLLPESSLGRVISQFEARMKSRSPQSH